MIEAIKELRTLAANVRQSAEDVKAADVCWCDSPSPNRLTPAAVQLLLLVYAAEIDGIADWLSDSQDRLSDSQDRAEQRSAEAEPQSNWTPGRVATWLWP